jgi:hypothetical protein
MRDDRVPTTMVDPEESDPRTAPTALVGTVGVVLLAVSLLLLEVLYQRTSQAEIERKVVAEPPQELRQLEAQQLERLAGYAWVDRERGIVKIPVERAMDLVIEETEREGLRERAAP